MGAARARAVRGAQTLADGAGCRTDEHNDFQEDIVVDGVGHGELCEEIEEIVAPCERPKVKFRQAQVGEAAEDLHEELCADVAVLQQQHAPLHVRRVTALQVQVFHLRMRCICQAACANIPDPSSMSIKGLSHDGNADSVMMSPRGHHHSLHSVHAAVVSTCTAQAMPDRLLCVPPPCSVALGSARTGLSPYQKERKQQLRGVSVVGNTCTTRSLAGRPWLSLHWAVTPELRPQTPNRPIPPPHKQGGSSTHTHAVGT